MSGGSWDYFCFQVDEVADRLAIEKSPLRRAFGQHMKVVAKAMKEIEWVDSGDKSSPVDSDAIKEVFASVDNHPEIKVLLDDAKNIIKQLKELGA